MSSALYPPNSHWLSDQVIGAVSCGQTSVRGRYRENKPGPALFSPPTTSTRTTERFDHNSSLTYGCVAVRDHIPTPPTSFGVSTEGVPRHSGKRATNPATTTDRPPTHAKNDKLSDEDALQLHRERRRLTQIRYRKKLRNHENTLDEEVQTLRADVQRLEVQHQSLSPRIIASATPWSVVTEYFRLFRYALTAYVPVEERCNAPGWQTLHESRAHRDFLQVAMAPDVMFEDFEIVAVNIENGPGDSIVARTKTKVVVREAMLRYAFPKLATSDRGRSIAAKLLGQRFETSGAAVFEWDSENGRVLSVDSESDVLTPMMHLLSNAEDLAFTFDEALLTLDGRLKIN
ncbi:BZIP transcription factor [Phytophthora cinnamomi]|uniref:BZIP transcription factor n=1 Tax=Phytophthora cinnamomi TaxID=4785 RepID=UPI003559C079|nr:BZIP transcription factor [Phytophthora cinnamomi]